MNRFRAIANRITTWWHWVMVLMITCVFLGALLTAPTDEDPAGNARLFAPIIALCTASMVLARAMKGCGPQLRSIPSLFFGLGSMAIAYLWIADAAAVHSANLSFLLILLILFGVVALPMTPLLLSAPWDNPQSNDKSSSEEDYDK